MRCVAHRWRLKILRVAGISDAARLVAFTLSVLCDDEGETTLTSASIGDLCRAAHLTRRAVQGGIRELQTAGLLSVGRSVGGEHFNTNKFVLSVEQPSRRTGAEGALS